MVGIIKPEYEIIGLYDIPDNYKLRIRRLSDEQEKEFNVTNSFVETCKKKYPSNVFQRFRDINQAINWNDATVDSDKLLECIGKYNEGTDNVDGDGRMML